MSKFFCIVSDINQLSNPDTFNLLKKAADDRGLEFLPLSANTENPAKVGISSRDILYRLGVSKQAKFLEGLLSSSGAISLYTKPDGVYARSFSWGSTLKLQAANLPIIPTLFAPAVLSEKELTQEVGKLGGFPVVVKGTEGSHGSAVRQAAAMPELVSMLEEDTDHHDLVLRQFIHEARHIRVVVVGGEAIDAIEYQPQPDDFRTNAVAVPQVSAFDLRAHPNIEKVAIDAVRAIELEFGGVDILLQPDGRFFVAEVNFPCNFARNQLNTGADIAGAIVDYLIKKLES